VIKKPNATKKLDDKWINILNSLPEAGMGYQIIDVELKDGTVHKRLVVFNGEYLEFPQNIDFDINDIVSISVVYS